MSKVNLFLSSLAALVAVVLLAGCPAEEETSPPPAAEESDGGGEHADADHDDGDHEHGDHEHGDHEHADDAAADSSSAVKDAMAQLSAEDRAAAEAQKICPVSGGALGAMGTPCKVTVTTGEGKERTVFLCCAGCESAIKAEPDKHLAKLDE